MKFITLTQQFKGQFVSMSYELRQSFLRKCNIVE